MLTRIVKTTLFLNDTRQRFNKKTYTRADGEWLKNRLQDMGPTFVKIGQFMTSRKDIFDAEIIESLKDLQDNVNNIDSIEIDNVIKNSINIKSFKKIERKPIASASIGQVHRAIKKNSQRCVIKLRRPNINVQIEEDLIALFLLINILEFLRVPSMSETREVMEDFRDFVLEEADYKNELKNMILFSDSNIGNNDIILPTLDTSLCTNDAIVMSYVKCQKFDAIKPNLTSDQRSQLAYKLMDLFVNQLVEKGVIHGDPHQGNIGYNVAADKFVIYDFGNIIVLKQETRDLFKRFILEVMTENIDGAIKVLYKIDLITIKDENILRVYLKKYFEYIKTIDINVFKVSVIDQEEYKKLPVKFDGVMFRLIRVFGIVEGICKDLDPKFSYNTIFSKYINTFFSDANFMDYKVKSDIRSILNSILNNL